MKNSTLRLLPAALVVAGLVALVAFSLRQPPPASPPAAGAAAPAASPPAVAVTSSAPATAPVPVHITRLQESPPRPEPVPPKGVAKVTLGSRDITPPNRVAHFERIRITSAQEIPIEVAWPEDKTSTEVLAHAIDGGTIDRATTSRRMPLTPGEPVRFTFTAGRGAGLYQVLLRRGTLVEVLEFWVPTTHPENDPPALN